MLLESNASACIARHAPLAITIPAAAPDHIEVIDMTNTEGPFLTPAVLNPILSSTVASCTPAQLNLVLDALARVAYGRTQDTTATIDTLLP